MSGSKHTRPLEFATRKKIDLMLINLGWHTDEEKPNCNAFAGRAKTKEQNKKFKGTQPDYVLYKFGTDTPIAIIEAKRKGESIGDAITQGEGYANALGVKVVFAYDGAFFKSWHTVAQKELYVDGIAITQLISEKKLLRFLTEGYSITEITPKVRHSRAELINIFKWTNNQLRKEGIREGIERFTEFANLLFLKLISELEKEREKEGEESILDPQFSWDAFSNLEDYMMMNYINNTVLPHLVEEYNHSGDVFQKELGIKNPKTLKSIVNKLSSINLMDADTDVKGDAFEYFLKDSVTVGNDLGEYFTPRHIVNLMVELIEPKFGEKIYDPTCGTGGFLIAAFNYIKKRIAKNKVNFTKLKEETVYGREFTDTAKVSKMNMIITGDGHTNVKQMDSLANPVIEEYDVVLANPPYGQKTDYGNFYPVPSDEGDSIFIQHMFKSLKNEGGRAAVVVPEGLLFRPSDLKVRKYLLEHCNVKAVISLPVGVFRPYTNNKTNIIIFEKDPDQEHPKGTESVWFYNLEADGFELNSDLRLPVDENDIPDLLSKYSDKVESSKSWNANIETIRKHNYDLLAKTYQPRDSHYYSSFPVVKFADIMNENIESIKIDDSKEYSRITVKLHGLGVVFRDTRIGKKIKTKRQKVVKAGQFIVAELDAKFGAFGIIPKDLEGAIVSSHYWLFDLDTNRILPEYFDYVIRNGPYESLIRPNVKGTTNYAAPRPKHILALELPLPPMAEQRETVRRLVEQIEMKQKAEVRFNQLLKELIIEPSFKQVKKTAKYTMHQPESSNRRKDDDLLHYLD